MDTRISNIHHYHNTILWLFSCTIANIIYLTSYSDIQVDIHKYIILTSGESPLLLTCLRVTGLISSGTGSFSSSAFTAVTCPLHCEDVSTRGELDVITFTSLGQTFYKLHVLIRAKRLLLVLKPLQCKDCEGVAHGLLKCYYFTRSSQHVNVAILIHHLLLCTT